MARDWDVKEEDVRDTENGETSMSVQAQRSDIGVDRKQAPMEDVLISLDMTIAKLDKVATALTVQLGPITKVSATTEGAKSSSPPDSNSAIVGTLKEYQRRITAIIAHLSVTASELEI